MVDKPVKESKIEKPKPEESASSTASPTGDVATAAGTDQYGRQLFTVKCSACGKETQVPFKPTGDRPVYCRDCYMKQRRGGMGRDMGRGMDRRGPRR